MRFGTETQYCLLDIDIRSAYHPKQDPLAIERIADALEPLGLVSYVACTSSYSQGLHLYFPFETSQNSWQLSAVVTTLLENQGFKCQPGQLEVFPNPKLYVVDGTPNLFNAHRLPLQAGSYLLNDQLEPISSHPETFVRQWQWCQQRNSIDSETIDQLLQQQRRHRHRVSQRADKFLNDLNAEVEVGWTGKGQTNRLLGRITMRAYVFHHIIHGGLPLSGDALIEAIVSTAQSLPGYREWCGHQHEIHQRAAEWARCVENSQYFPYGTPRGKYKSKQDVKDSAAVETTWNEQRSQTAQSKIQAAMLDLYNTGNLPQTTTARFQKLLGYGIGGSTLYKYKPLWHPDLWKTPQTPQPLNGAAALATAAPANAAHPTSLLPDDARNPLPDKGLTHLEEAAAASEVRNEDALGSWRKVFLDLKTRQAQQKRQARSQKEAYRQSRARQDRQSYREKMMEYLQSGDPILIREAEQWLYRENVNEQNLEPL
ncbi:hypothetical protein PN498_27080 [Oscillatoria sp. CS-180]|uniref:hypothetical protein n=1 Tax=Oscillatoria sp. CS-180 TaxID=3021720 RepID=UPI00232DE686|nr:hypothetical protein [Oscillatoria sp. CS-180]MDB9529681.1 hypothetical protein [Oscillatoria sp. CS-180]